jgi:hypothetical protein
MITFLYFLSLLLEAFIGVEYLSGTLAKRWSEAIVPENAAERASMCDRITSTYIPPFRADERRA